MSELYKSMGRSWIKLWVPEWLDGTSRYEMSGGQRAFWVDLLTLAGRSRIPGIVCAGEDPNNLFGYPLDRYAGILGDGSVDILETFKLFESQGKIEIVVTREESPKLYAIKILSWAKYQSEYMRQRAYRAKVRPKTRRGAGKVTFKNTPRLPVDGDVDGDVDGEGDTKTHARVSQLGSTEFKSFFEAYPLQIGRKAALREWIVQRLDSVFSKVMSSLAKWKASERWQNEQFIPYPGKWLADQWKSEPVKGTSNGSRQPDKEQRRGERSQQAIQNALGHRSRLADALRADLPGRGNRRVGPALPASPERHPPGDSAQSIPASSEELHVPPDASGSKTGSGS